MSLPGLPPRPRLMAHVPLPASPCGRRTPASSSPSSRFPSVRLPLAQEAGPDLRSPFSSLQAPSGLAHGRMSGPSGPGPRAILRRHLPRLRLPRLPQSQPPPHREPGSDVQRYVWPQTQATLNESHVIQHGSGSGTGSGGAGRAGQEGGGRRWARCRGGADQGPLALSAPKV